jgi:peptidoglycan-associated lipoprotein
MMRIPRIETPLRHAALAALVAVTLVVAGCARKAVEQPPTPAPAPAQPAPTPPPAEKTPTPTPPPAPEITSSDFQPAFFDYDSYVLRDDARTALDHDAEVLRTHADLKITVEGHCDERGTVEYNQALGEKRAQAARDYLTSAGINGSRINVVSYGKERPFDPGHDEAAWAKNRRAQVVLQ